MEYINELEVAKAYEGKPYIAQKIWKIAIGSGNTRAVVFSRRISQSQGALIGITDEIYNKWWDDDIYFGVFIDIEEESCTIKTACIHKTKVEYSENGSFRHIELSPTQQEIKIFTNIMEYITQEER